MTDKYIVPRSIDDMRSDPDFPPCPPHLSMQAHISRLQCPEYQKEMREAEAAANADPVTAPVETGTPE